VAGVTEADKVVLVKVADEHKEVDQDDKCVELADQIPFEVALLVAENDKVEVACLRIDVLAVESLVDAIMEVNKLVPVEVAHGLYQLEPAGGFLEGVDSNTVVVAELDPKVVLVKAAELHVDDMTVDVAAEVDQLTTVEVAGNLAALCRQTNALMSRTWVQWWLLTLFWRSNKFQLRR
jgi:hypothetical protein